MNRCFSCKNTRRQLLMLRCSHDVCIKCAADNYFINCRNRPSHKTKDKDKQSNNYFCENCLEQTPLESKTIDRLKEYFMENTAEPDQKYKQDFDQNRIARREKTKQREQEEKKKIQRIQKYENQERSRGKSWEIQLESRKKSLKNYLNSRQVDRFMQMQEEYQPKPEKDYQARQQVKQTVFSNDYELPYARLSYKKSNNHIKSNESLLPTRHSYKIERIKSQEYGKQKRQSKATKKEYGIAKEYLQQNRPDERQSDRRSRCSVSGEKQVGKIRTKKHKNDPQENTNYGLMLARIPSQQSQAFTPMLPVGATENSIEWEVNSYKNQERTVPKVVGRGNMEGILQHFQVLQKPQLQALEQLPEVYYCKIHEEEEIIYFCLKCNQLICSQCALRGSHKTHQIYSLKKTTQLLSQNLLSKTSTLAKLMSEEQSKQKILKECLSELSSQVQSQKQKVKTAFESFLFTVDKKYKELLKQIQERFQACSQEYIEKLDQTRDNYVKCGRLKDQLQQLLQAVSGDQSSEKASVTMRQGNFKKRGNQLGNFNVKKDKRKSTHEDILSIQRLMSKINEAHDFLKNSNLEVFSGKKQSLLSDPSSLRLSDSENLLQDEPVYPGLMTPATSSASKSPQMRLSCETPEKSNRKKIILGAYCLNVSQRVKVYKTEVVIQGLMEMEKIVREVKMRQAEYWIKALA